MESPVRLGLTTRGDGGVPKLVMTVGKTLRLTGAEEVTGTQVAVHADDRSGLGSQIEVETVSIEAFVGTGKADPTFCRQCVLRVVVCRCVGFNDDVLIRYGDPAGPCANLFGRLDTLLFAGLGITDNRHLVRLLK